MTDKMILGPDDGKLETPVHGTRSLSVDPPLKMGR
jgi:hypothetical protein